MIDVIIVNYNATEALINCLDSLYQDLNGLSATITVVDNGSSDDFIQIQNRFPKVNLISNNRNMGFASAVNQAIKLTSSSLVILLNPDSSVKKGFFSSILSLMEKNKNFAIVGPRIRNVDGSIQGSARSFPTFLTGLFGRSSLLSRLFPNNSITRSNVLTVSFRGRHPLLVDWVSGACMVINRKAIEMVGLLDERFFMYWEDADWCKRMRDAGWKVAYFPFAEITHIAGVSSRKRPIGSLLEFHKSAFRLFDKYNPSLPFFLKTFVLSLLFYRFVLLFFYNIFIRLHYKGNNLH